MITLTITPTEYARLMAAVDDAWKREADQGAGRAYGDLFRTLARQDGGEAQRMFGTKGSANEQHHA